MKINKIFKKTRVIILILALIISIALINPQLNNDGVAIRSVDPLSNAYSSGLRSPLQDTNPTNYEKIIQINSNEIINLQDYSSTISTLTDSSKITITTNSNIYTFDKDKQDLGLIVTEFPDSNLRKGLDLQGGTRVLLKPLKETTNQEIEDVVSILDNRLNVYGLSDVNIRSTQDLEGNNFVLIEIAGATQEEVTSIIASQGKFEAKISNQTVFQGGKQDITFVCRNDGTCSGITQCSQSTSDHICRFEFQISLSNQAAKKHSEITKNLEIITSEHGDQILSEPIVFFLDDREIDSLNIASSLKGIEASNIVISGSGLGLTEEQAFEEAEQEMNRLQTALITGSLPFELEIVQLDSISPFLGADFLKTAIISGIAAILAVTIIIFIRFRTIKIALPMLFIIISEVIIILGFAAIFKQNLDLAAIAGIIAAVGTGVDDQIIIIDEVLGKNRETYGNWKTRLKNAFFIILAAYFTTLAAMAPLFRAGAGLIRGFAFVTIIGVTIGVLLTRPAFASILEVLNKKEE